MLTNACDAIENLNDKWLEVTVTKTTDVTVISITDSGSGISPEVSDKMMQPFYTTKEVGKGTGLGLSISQGIIASHNGSFYYDAKSPHTRFVIELPLTTSKTAPRKI